MKLRQCDQCGAQSSGGEAQWINFTDESATYDRSEFIAAFMTGSRSEVCSWDCLRDYAILKLTEAEVTS